MARTTAGSRQLLSLSSKCMSFSAGQALLSTRVTSAIDNFSISAWIKPTLPQTTGFVFYNGDDTSGWGLGCGGVSDASGSRLIALFGGAAWLDSGVTLTSGVWQHVAFVRGNGTSYFYVNGGRTISVLTTPGIPTAGKACIGSEATPAFRPYIGLADSVACWNVALTDSQILDLAQNLMLPTTGLLGYWEFEEGSGATVSDSSGQSNTGTITNATFSSTVRTQPTRSVATGRVAA